MRAEFPSDLPKLGHRPYIQGGSIFNEILDVCDRCMGPGWLQDAVIKSFKLERESFGNGGFVVSDAAEDVAANASFVARNPRGGVYVHYFDEGRPTRQEPYDEESYYCLTRIGDLEGEFVFPGGRPRADFMRGIVGANKLLHQKTTRFNAPLTHIQFLYLKGLEAACILRSAEEYRIGIANMTVQERESEVWTINHVAVRAASFSSEFRICYRAARQAP
jgi:hypothetical protein